MTELTTFLLVGRQSKRFEDVRLVARRVRRWFERRGLKEEILRKGQKKAVEVEEGEEENIQDYSDEGHDAGEEENAGEEEQAGEEENAGEEEHAGDEENAGEDGAGEEEQPDLDDESDNEGITSLEPKIKKSIPSKPNGKEPYIISINCILRDPSSASNIHIYGDSHKGTGVSLNLDTKVLTPLSHPLGRESISRVIYYKTKQIFVSYTKLYIFDTASKELFLLRTQMSDSDDYDIASRYHNPHLCGSVLYIIVYNNRIWTVDLEDPKLIANKFSRKEFSQVISHRNLLVGVHNSGTIRSLDPKSGTVLKESILMKKPDRCVIGIPLGNHLLLSWTHADIDKEESTEVKFMLVRPRDFKIVGTQTVHVELHREDRQWESDLLQVMYAYVRRGGSFIFHIHRFGRMGILFRRGPKLHVVLETIQAVRGDRIAGSLLHPNRDVLLLSQYFVYGNNFKPSVVQLKLNW